MRKIRKYVLEQDFLEPGEEIYRRGLGKSCSFIKDPERRDFSVVGIISLKKYPGLIAAWNTTGKSNTAEGKEILEDLTGNGYNISLNGFSWNDTGGYDSSGGLKFADGCYGINNKMPTLKDYTIISKRTYTANGCLIGYGGGSVGTTVIGFDGFGLSGKQYSFSTSNAVEVVQTDISWQTKDVYNGSVINYGNLVPSGDQTITIGKIYTGDSRYYDGIFYSAYLFNRSLGEGEIKRFIRLYIDSEYELPGGQKPIMILDKEQLDNSRII